MSKIKNDSKNGLYSVVIKGTKGEQLNAEMTNWLLTNKIDGFVSLKISNFNENGFEITYKIDNYITLKQFLKKTIEQRMFYNLISSIINTMSSLVNYHMSYSNIVLNFETVAVDPTSGKALLLYYPVNNYSNKIYFKEFIGKLLKQVKPVKTSDKTYLKELKELLKNNEYPSWEDFKNYIKKIELPDNIQRVPNIEFNNANNTFENQGVNNCICDKCGASIPKNSKFCALCGNRIDNALSQSLRYMNNYSNSMFDNDGGTTLLVENDESEGATTLLTNNLVSRKFPSLRRVSTNEIIVINNDNFTIGKSQTCNYVITDNNTISRKHVSIIYEGERYYLIDNASTNHTYVDGKLIVPNTKIVLHNGMKIKLSNEEFSFSEE